MQHAFYYHVLTGYADLEYYKMTTDKAPLPDEVERAFAVIEEYTHPMVKFEAQSIIRAHISAQAERIEELEAGNKRLREQWR